MLDTYGRKGDITGNFGTLSLEKKNFVLGRRGQVSGWEGAGTWGQRRKEQRFNCQGKNALLGSVVLH